MNQFSDSILRGIKNAEAADANVKEIHRVLDELSEAITQVTNGLIHVVKERGPATSSFSNKSITNAITAVITGGIHYQDIISLRRAVPPHQMHEIARLDIPSSGYPCDVIASSRRQTCHDATSLVKVLQGILAGPEAGKIILRLKELREEKAKPTPSE